MNNDNDFGQYNCISENIHGRMEAIVFVLSTYSFDRSIDRLEIYLKCLSFVYIEESIITTKKFFRQSKKFTSIKKSFRTTTATIERGIYITSSSTWTSDHRWEKHFLLFFFLILYWSHIDD